MKHSVPKVMSRAEVAEETERDLVSNLLKLAITTNIWDDKRVVMYKKIYNELSITDDGIILRGTRMLLPTKLRKKAISIAHEAHQGIEKTKAILREKVWFPNMDGLVKDTIGSCIPCLATGKDVPPEPVSMTEMPKGPWVKLHIDFKGPLTTENICW